MQHCSEASPFHFVVPLSSATFPLFLSPLFLSISPSFLLFLLTDNAVATPPLNAMSSSDISRLAAPPSCGGYDLSLFVGPLETGEYTCSICHDVLRDPVEAYNVEDDGKDEADPCCHLFCFSCISKWLLNHNSCPECRKYLTLNHLHRAVRLKRKIWALKVRCTRFELGCEGIGALGRDGVFWKEHEKKCQYRTQSCDYCGMSILKSSFAKHRLSQCEKRPTPCESCELHVPLNK